MTWLSVSSDVAPLDNFLPHLHSTEQRRESVTVDIDSDTQICHNDVHSVIKVTWKYVKCE